MISEDAILDGMEVISADGVHVGLVDAVADGRIKLRRRDRSSGGRHHFIDTAHVAGIEGDKVRLAFESELVTSLWATEYGFRVGAGEHVSGASED